MKDLPRIYKFYKAATSTSVKRLPLPAPICLDLKPPLPNPSFHNISAMTSAGASLLAYAATSLTVLITYFVFFPPNSQSKYQYSTTPTYLRPTLSALVLVHTLFILYELLLNPPTNLFTALDLPLPYPTDSIRSLLLMLSDDPASGLPGGIERVLTRLGSAGMRLLYVRCDVIAN